MTRKINNDPEPLPTAVESLQVRGPKLSWLIEKKRLIGSWKLGSWTFGCSEEESRCFAVRSHVISILFTRPPRARSLFVPDGRTSVL